MRSQLKLLVLLFIISSCSFKNNFYLTRYAEPKGGWNNYTIHCNEKNELILTKMNRLINKLNKSELILKNIGKNKYLNTSHNIKVILNNKTAKLIINENEIKLNRIIQSKKDSNIETINDVLIDNYIIHINQHQKTKFDLKKDSISYLIKNIDSIPYQKETWFIFKIKKEVFLTYYSGSQNIYRIELRDSRLIKTFCQKGDCMEFEIQLESKMKNENDQ